MTPDRTVRTAILATAVVAVAVLAGMAFIGRLRAGLAIDLGLVIGATNGPMIQRSVQLGLGFGALSMVRLLVLSALAVGLGLALSPSLAWLVLVGVACAQIVLACAGAWGMMTR
jgi:hypothetical protein